MFRSLLRPEVSALVSLSGASAPGLGFVYQFDLVSLQMGRSNHEKRRDKMSLQQKVPPQIVWRVATICFDDKVCRNESRRNEMYDDEKTGRITLVRQRLTWMIYAKTT